MDKLIELKGLNCRYSTFITLYYFVLSEYIDYLKGKEFTDLKDLNNLILNLVDDVSDDNYNKIIEFFQSKGYDSNNLALDKIKNEKNPKIY